MPGLLAQTHAPKMRIGTALRKRMRRTVRQFLFGGLLLPVVGGAQGQSTRVITLPEGNRVEYRVDSITDQGRGITVWGASRAIDRPSGGLENKWRLALRIDDQHARTVFSARRPPASWQGFIYAGNCPIPDRPPQPQRFALFAATGDLDLAPGKHPLHLQLEVVDGNEFPLARTTIRENYAHRQPEWEVAHFDVRSLKIDSTAPEEWDPLVISNWPREDRKKGYPDVLWYLEENGRPVYRSKINDNALTGIPETVRHFAPAGGRYALSVLDYDILNDDDPIGSYAFPEKPGTTGGVLKGRLIDVDAPWTKQTIRYPGKDGRLALTAMPNAGIPGWALQLDQDILTDLQFRIDHADVTASAPEPEMKVLNGILQTAGDGFLELNTPTEGKLILWWSALELQDAQRLTMTLRHRKFGPMPGLLTTDTVALPEQVDFARYFSVTQISPGFRYGLYGTWLEIQFDLPTEFKSGLIRLRALAGSHSLPSLSDVPRKANLRGPRGSVRIFCPGRLLLDDKAIRLEAKSGNGVRLWRDSREARTASPGRYVLRDLRISRPKGVTIRDETFTWYLLAGPDAVYESEDRMLRTGAAIDLNWSGSTPAFAAMGSDSLRLVLRTQGSSGTTQLAFVVCPESILKQGGRVRKRMRHRIPLTFYDGKKIKSVTRWKVEFELTAVAD